MKILYRIPFFSPDFRVENHTANMMPNNATATPISKFISIFCVRNAALISKFCTDGNANTSQHCISLHLLDSSFDVHQFHRTNHMSHYVAHVDNLKLVVNSHDRHFFCRVLKF